MPTRSDGTETVPARGNWSRVYYTSGGTGTLDGAEIRYAGYSSAIAVYCATGSPSRIAGSTIRLNNGTGLFCDAGSCPASVSGNTFADNSTWPIRMYPSDASKIAADNVFTGNKYQGVFVYGTSLSAAAHAWAVLPVPWYLESTLTMRPGGAVIVVAELRLVEKHGGKRDVLPP